MIIAIDASRAIREKPTGTEFYSARLIQYLATIDHENRYWLYAPAPPPETFPQLPDNFEWRIIPFPRLWTHIRLSLALLFDKPDLLFVPAHVIPLFCPVKVVVTLHDLAYHVFPEAFSWPSRWYAIFADRLALKRARAIITPSQATKNDIIKIYETSGQKIFPIHLGFDVPDTKKVSLPTKTQALQPYILMIGRLETRKNTALAIKAFAEFRHRNPDDKTKLVLVGKPGYGYEKVKATIESLPGEIAPDVIEIGYASDEELTAYRAGALAFLYPSLYEGFGLTVLEAMAADLPVITSDSSSMPEVVDDAAIIVNPESIDEIVHALTILTTNDLSRNQFIERGHERIKDFSWQKTAAETLAILEKVNQGEL